MPTHLSNFVGDNSSCSFELTAVEVDHPMVDLSTISIDGKWALTISAFDVSFICLPTFLRKVGSLEGQKISAPDLSDADQDKDLRDLSKVVFKSDKGKIIGYIICREIMMLCHNSSYRRIAFNNAEVRADRSTTIVFYWQGLEEQVFSFSEDNSRN